MRRWWLAGLMLVSSSGGQPPSADVVLPGMDLRPISVGVTPRVKAVLGRVPPGVRTGLLVQRVADGVVLEEQAADTPFIPASTVKLVTGAATLFERGGAEGWWSAELTVPATQAARVEVKAITLRGSGDPTLRVSQGPYSLRALAQQAYARGVRVVGQVRVDDARLDSATWRKTVLGVPMTALRLAEWHDSPPNSAQQAREWLGVALRMELRRAGIQVRSKVVGQATPYTPYVPLPRQDEKGNPLPPDPFIPVERRPEVGVASVRSASPAQVLTDTLRPSDNLLAEELLAVQATAGQGTLARALSREGNFLQQLGVNTAGVVLADGSGLSRQNRLTARALVDLLVAVHQLPYPVAGQSGRPADLYATRRNALVEALPQAGTGENTPDHDGRGGTLAQRLVGRNLDVRAKTGTLPGVSALAGYVTGRSGQLLAFAVLMNGSQPTSILNLRALQDELVLVVAFSH